MRHDRTLEELWTTAAPSTRRFDPASVERLPPTVRLRVGWLFGTTRFEAEGEFFRCTLRRATYR